MGFSRSIHGIRLGIICCSPGRVVKLDSTLRQCWATIRCKKSSSSSRRESAGYFKRFVGLYEVDEFLMLLFVFHTYGDW